MKRISVSGEVLGQHAGSINITLEKSGSQIRYHGLKKLSSLIGHEDYFDELISPAGAIELYAEGRAGASGIIGQNGKDGAPGRRGLNATTTRLGGSGGPGGDGADGQPGTSGGDGGRGGDITIYAKPEDIDLFELITKVSLSGGEPGKKGSHGKGGLGGRGGTGGATYCWTTSKTILESTPVPESTSIMVSRSSPSARLIHEAHYEHSPYAHARIYSHSPYETPSYHAHSSQYMPPIPVALRPKIIYESHVSAGGGNGANGRDGKTPTSYLIDGQRGINGTKKYVILGEGIEHTNPYALSLEAAFPQTTYEPYQIIQAHFQVSNSGETMYSPSGILIKTESNPALKQLEDGKVEGRIPPQGMRRTSFPLQFYFTAPNRRFVLNPYSEQHQVSFYLYNTTLQRPYNATKKTSHFTIQYPVKLQSPTTQYYSIGQDEEQTFQTVVHNIGVESLGEKTTSQRKVILDISPDLFDTPSEQAISISSLTPGSSYSIDKITRFNSSDAYGSVAQYQVKLYLQVFNPESKLNVLKLIQHYPVRIQFTPKYRATGNGFLLVIDSQTTSPEIQAWIQTLNSLIKKPDIAIWNSSYYKEFSLDKGLALDTYSGTVIVLDKTFRGISSEKRNSDYLVPSLYLEASEHNISLVTVGENKNFSSFTLEDYRPRSHASLDAMINVLFTQSNLPFAHQVPVSSTGFLGFNTPLKQAVHLEKKLKNIFPEQQYSVNYDSASKKLIVRRLLENLLPFIDKENSNDFHTRVLPLKLLPFLSFKHKLGLFLQTENSYHRQLANTLLNDLLQEQAQLVKAINYQGLWNQITKKHQYNFSLEIDKLSQLVSFMEDMKPENMAVWTPLVLNLIATLQYEVKQHTSFWTRLMAFIFSNEKEQLKVNTLDLCNKARVALNVDTKVLSLEENRVALQKKIQACIIETTFLWGKPRLNPEEKMAARALLNVCKRECSQSDLNLYQNIWENNAQLKQLKNDLLKLNGIQLESSPLFSPQF